MGLPTARGWEEPSQISQPGDWLIRPLSLPSHRPHINTFAPHCPPPSCSGICSPQQPVLSKAVRAEVSHWQFAPNRIVRASNYLTNLWVSGFGHWVWAFSDMMTGPRREVNTCPPTQVWQGGVSMLYSKSWILFMKHSKMLFTEHFKETDFYAEVINTKNSIFFTCLPQIKKQLLLKQHKLIHPQLIDSFWYNICHNCLWAERISKNYPATLLESIWLGLWRCGPSQKHWDHTAKKTAYNLTWM